MEFLFPRGSEVARGCDPGGFRVIILGCSLLGCSLPGCLHYNSLRTKVLVASVSFGGIRLYSTRYHSLGGPLKQTHVSSERIRPRAPLPTPRRPPYHQPRRPCPPRPQRMTSRPRPQPGPHWSVSQPNVEDMAVSTMMVEPQVLDAGVSRDGNQFSLVVIVPLQRQLSAG